MKKPQVQKPALLREQVYHLIMSYISNGYYQPGDHLTEEGVAGDLGVSRTPVREALSQLAVSRLLEKRKNGGYLIRSLSVEEIKHIFEVRTLLEPFAIARIASDHTDSQLRALDRALQKEIRHLHDSTPAEFAQANEQFHSALFDDLANSELRRCISQFDVYMHLLRLLTLSDLATREIVTKGHKEILAAIEAHDQSAVKKAMVQHIRNAEKCIIEAIEKDLGDVSSHSDNESQPGKVA